MVYRDTKYDAQIHASIDHGRTARDRYVRKGRERERTCQRGLHLVSRASPERLARIDQAVDDAERYDVAALRKAADLLQPADHEGDSLKAKDDHAIGERREPRSEHEREAQCNDAFEDDQQQSVERMLREHPRHRVRHGDRRVECDDPVSYTHLRAHETGRNLVCRLLLEKKKKKQKKK